MFNKRIVCFANSRKLNGRCIAGKDIKTGDWIRPVSNSLTGELSIEQIEYKDGSLPEIFDIIEIPLTNYLPGNHQKENYLIANRLWKKIEKLGADLVNNYLDKPETLWNITGYKNDRVTNESIIENKIENSLYLIETNYLKINRTQNYRGEIQLRALFSYKNNSYDLVITDLNMEDAYRDRKEGIYKIKNTKIFLCVSLGEEFHGCCYKLVAAVILIN